MSDISREEVISKLKDLLLKIEDPTDTKLGWLETWVTKEDIEAIKYAISSIKTDLKYDLMYENDCVIILDEDRCGNSFEKDIFIKYFEEENDKER